MRRNYSWIKALKEDKNEIFKAAKDAGKAVDYIMERTKELKKDTEVGKDAFSKDLESRLEKSNKLAR